MIILTEVAKKIDKILNNGDSEYTKTNPAPFEFVVATEGFHLDSISDRPNGENFIPVFISSMGGEFNPVKGLKQSNYSIPIVFYYPVRFKEIFFELGDFLEDAFVGSYFNYGLISGKAVSNISVPRYGELQNIDLKEFKEWVGSTYKREISVRELYLSMQVTLFLSTAKNGLVFGNDVTNEFSFTYSGTTLTLENVFFDGASIQSNSQAQSEQEEETTLKERLISAIEDEKFLLAIEVAVKNAKISTSLLQRKLNIGYGHAKKIIDDMYQCGYILNDTSKHMWKYLYNQNAKAEIAFNESE